VSAGIERHLAEAVCPPAKRWPLRLRAVAMVSKAQVMRWRPDAWLAKGATSCCSDAGGGKSHCRQPSGALVENDGV